MILLLLGAVYVVPGILFWVFGEPLRKRNEWAAVVLMVMGSLSALGGVVLLIFGILRAMNASELANQSDRPGYGAGVCFGLLISIGVAVAILVLSIKLIMQSSKSIKAIRYMASAGLPLGFQPVMPAPGPYPPDDVYPPTGAYPPPGVYPPPPGYPPPGPPTEPPPSQGGGGARGW
jgi:hypothetical protein